MEEYAKLSNKYDELQMNYDHKVNECEGLEKDYIDMADKYNELVNQQKMGKEDSDTSDEEFKAEPKQEKKTEVSET